MIPGFSGLPVLYLHSFRGFVLKLNMIDRLISDVKRGQMLEAEAKI